MDLEQAKAFLAQAEEHRQPTYEPSIFALGARAYYENPTTDLLAFFLDPGQRHGLGNCFLQALLNVVNPSLSPTLRLPPQREVNTPNGNRIDVLLHGDGWLLVLENKIFHHAINPFDDYEAYAKTLAKSHTPMFVVLSPAGNAAKGNWVGLSYTTFLAALREQLPRPNPRVPLDKWQVLAGEFLLHLENVTTERAMNPDSIDFVFDHLPQIKALNELRDKAFEALDRKILATFQSNIPGYKPYTRRHTWDGWPALRYACKDWETWSDVVLYLDYSQTVLRPLIRVYLCDVDERLMEQGRRLFVGTSIEPWTEGNYVIGFQWQLEAFDEEVIFGMLLEKMRLLMGFENDVRGG
ncbi:PD-(D/E)XK nuclease family protein [Pseudomonas sp. SDO528_S397]